MYCTNCGKQMDDKADFCLSCGKQINKPVAPVVKTVVNTPEEEKTGTNSLAILGFCLSFSPLVLYLILILNYFNVAAVGYAFIAVISAIIPIIICAVSFKDVKTKGGLGLAIAGIIISVILLVMCMPFILLYSIFSTIG